MGAARDGAAGCLSIGMCFLGIWSAGWALGAAHFFCRGNLLSLVVVGASVRVLLLWDGKRSAVHVAMQRAAMADVARFVGHCTAVHFLPCLGA